MNEKAEKGLTNKHEKAKGKIFIHTIHNCYLFCIAEVSNI